jgi:hypothetical protein
MSLKKAAILEDKSRRVERVSALLLLSSFITQEKEEMDIQTITEIIVAILFCGYVLFSRSQPNLEDEDDGDYLNY